ncbi:ribonuclease inhibitor [Formivibrio citricus]|uniref:Ribonuclease inhibitor n=1 Tax=Formivibrio citricus TaxID=83765 RepID=A0A1I4YB88_9NEIS|nr:barstar family protein [Formivibrio citricus]SFN35324.1 ribonuclease inhibitor [Formivibrio citricus]
MPMIEFSNLRSLDDLWPQLEAQVDLPLHFGYNLDALFDVLSTDLEGPLTLVWHQHEASRTAMGEDAYIALLMTFEDAANARMDMELHLQ